MYENFGEVNSVEELNEIAAGKKAAGDEDALVQLALENGIDREDAEDYMDDCTDVFATPLMAAVGKIKVEVKDLKVEGVLLDWVHELEEECTESEDMVRAVRKKGKSLDGYIALLADNGFKNKVVVDKKIVKKCCKDIQKITGDHDFYIGIPDKATRKNLMKQYYLGK